MAIPAKYVEHLGFDDEAELTTLSGEFPNLRKVQGGAVKVEYFQGDRIYFYRGVEIGYNSWQPDKKYRLRSKRYEYLADCIEIIDEDCKLREG